MPIVLEGGCRVAGLREGTPERDGSLRIRKHFGRETGAHAISLRVLELDGGESAAWRNESSDEVLYVIAGGGAVTIGGSRYDLTADHGLYVPPDTTIELSASSAMTLVSAQCPEPGMQLDGYEAGRAIAGAPLVVAMHDRPRQQTGDPWYREVINGEAGSAQVTQFVGAIPPGRAPDHYHLYEEVLCILEGEGAMWAGTSQTPIAAGSCIYLPRRQVHCVENRGPGELRLLACSIRRGVRRCGMATESSGPSAHHRDRAVCHAKTQVCHAKTQVRHAKTQVRHAKTQVRRAKTQVCRARDTPAHRPRRRAVTPGTHLRHAATHLCHGETEVRHGRDAPSSREGHRCVTPATEVCRGQNTRCHSLTQVCRARNAGASRPAHRCVVGSAHARHAGKQVCRGSTAVPRAHADTATAQCMTPAAPGRLSATGTGHRAWRRRHGAYRGKRRGTRKCAHDPPEAARSSVPSPHGGLIAEGRGIG